MKLIISVRDFILNHQKLSQWIFVGLILTYIVARGMFGQDFRELALALVYLILFRFPLLYNTLGIEYKDKKAAFRPCRKQSSWESVLFYIILFLFLIFVILTLFPENKSPGLRNYIFTIILLSAFGYFLVSIMNTSDTVKPVYFKIIFTGDNLIFYSFNKGNLIKKVFNLKTTTYKFSNMDNIYLTDHSKADTSPLHVSVSEIHPKERSSFLNHLKSLVKAA